MKDILNRLFDYQKLSRQEAREVLTNIGNGQYNEAQIASFISVYIMRSISVDELAGFRDALLDLSVSVDLSAFDPVDMCGTGGDGKNTFNISTLAAFVVAGAGGKVAKHGNYGVSSVCGSSNVMEHLGYTFSNDADKLNREIDQADITIMHAPLFHPAMKYVAPIRRQLGVKTFFNMLGPLVNPASVKRQVVGVFNLEIARLYQYLHQQSDKQFAILHSLDGYDEISLTNDTKLITNTMEKIVSPDFFGYPAFKQADLHGDKDVPKTAQLFVDILEGRGTAAQQAVVVANAAMGLQCLSPDKSIADCVAQAKEALESGKARQVLKTLIDMQ